MGEIRYHKLGIDAGYSREWRRGLQVITTQALVAAKHVDTNVFITVSFSECYANR